jgi:predicted DCC family thiol-disulfide oxidoreductase YuxK
MDTTTSSPMVLFDGDCNFCNRSVQFVLDHEADSAFRFAASRSVPGQQALKECDLGCEPGSIVVIEAGRCYTKSSASIQLAKHLRMPWRLLGLLALIPRPIRDFGYNIIAANRYRISRRMPTCRVVSAAVAARFLA